MNFYKKLLHIRYLLLIFAVGLTTTTLSAQAVSQNTDEPQAVGKTADKDETTDKDETVNKNKPAKKDTKETELEKQPPPPKPPRFGGHVGVVIPIVTRGNGTTTTIADDFIIGFPFALVVRTNSPAAFDFEFVPISEHVVESGFQISCASGHCLCF